MNKLKELLLDAIQDSYVNLNPSENDNMWVIDYEIAGMELAEVTQKIAVEFADFYVSYCNKHGQTHSEEVFEEFLKTK